jgi:transcriptional regulator GlxA family with amidase domain
VTAIAVALFDGVEELDWAGPWEVFAMWASYWTGDDVHVFTVAETADVVTCAKGMRVVPHRAWTDVDAVDVLVYPGGRGTRAQLGEGNERLHERLRMLADRGTLMTSVCTGSLVYAAAGLLAGRPATTHWASLDTLRALDPSIDVRDDDRWVDAGSVVTASGVSAGIDMALHLVRRLHSDERAREVRRGMQYDPQPPV